MNLLERQLQAMVEFLSGQKIKYAVLGGIAVSVYGIPRLTTDIDVEYIKGWLEKIDQVNKGARLGAKFSSLLT